MNRYLRPFTYYSKLRRTFYQWFLHDPARVAAEEEAKFKKLGFDQAGAREALNGVLRGMGRADFDADMDSVHWLLLAALSRGPDMVERILELGTFEGETTAILGRLFPRARITTVDLPEDDPLHAALYDGEKEGLYARYLDLERRRRNLDASNITSLRFNSFFLLEKLREPMDLVWIDAGHHYPEVAWDLCAAYHLCRGGGFLLVDDVMARGRPYKDRYVSTESYEALRYLQARLDGGLTLFLKRRSPHMLAMPFERKHVAFYRKP